VSETCDEGWLAAVLARTSGVSTRGAVETKVVCHSPL